MHSEFDLRQLMRRLIIWRQGLFECIALWDPLYDHQLAVLQRVATGEDLTNATAAVKRPRYRSVASGE